MSLSKILPLHDNLAFSDVLLIDFRDIQVGGILREIREVDSAVSKLSKA